MATQIKKYAIKNFLGIKLLEEEPGKVTLIRGKTGTGKTSILEALSVAFTNKGWRSRLVREGEEEATLLVQLDDDKVIARTVKDGGGSVTVSQDGVTLPKPQAILNELCSDFAFNPAEFIQITAKEQGNLLLSLVEMELSEDEWVVLSGGSLLPKEAVDYTLHPLQVLKAIESVQYEKRTGVNSEAKSLKAHAEELMESIPEEFDPESIRGKELREVYDRLSSARGRNEDIGNKEYEVGVCSQRIADLKVELKAEMQDKQRFEQELKGLGEPTDLKPLEKETQTFEEKQKLLQKFDDATIAYDGAEKSEAEAANLTELIKTLRAKPLELIAEADLPVEGMTVDDDGEVLVDGRPIKSLSSGEQIQLALQVAKATSGDLKVLFVDGLEKLDSEAQEALKEIALKDGHQWFIAEVTDDELTVGTWESEEEEFEEELQAVVGSLEENADE